MSIEENIGRASSDKHKPGPVEGGIIFNPDTEYESQMSALTKQHEDFEKGIAEYQGNMSKVIALREKLKKPDLFTDKEAIEKWNAWKLNKSEYEGSLKGVEKQIQDLNVKYGKPEEKRTIN